MSDKVITIINFTLVFIIVIWIYVSSLDKDTISELQKNIIETQEEADTFKTNQLEKKLYLQHKLKQEKPNEVNTSNSISNGNYTITIY